MPNINISTSTNSDILFEVNLQEKLVELAANYTSVVIISGENTAKHWLDEVADMVPGCKKIIFESGEQNKTFKTAEKICEKLRGFGCDRKTVLISLGGGVTNDIVGFCASIYMRGVDWFTIPTTVIGAADASIGGKTGVNLRSYKNLLGSFHQPKAVLVNRKFLTTLDQEYVSEGFGEIIKMGVIADKNILQKLDKLPSSKVSVEEISEVIQLSAVAKVAIVNQDSHEAGKRKLLNFGHTIGHALESYSLNTNQPLLHGQAVGLGMVAESKLAELEGLCSSVLTDKIKAYCKKFAIRTSYKFDVKQVIPKLSSDKKNQASLLLWTLPKTIGSGVFDHQAKPENIALALKYINKAN